MPHFDKRGPRGQRSGKGLGGCQATMPTDHRDDNSFIGTIRRRVHGGLTEGQGLRRCFGGQENGRNRQCRQGQK